MMLTNPLKTRGLALSLDASLRAFQAWGVNTTFSSPAPDQHALLARPRLLRQADRGENEEVRPITCEGGGGECLSQN